MWTEPRSRRLEFIYIDSGNGELELTRPVVADELRPRHVESVRAVAEVFLDGEERVVRAGGLIHRVCRRLPGTETRRLDS